MLLAFDTAAVYNERAILIWIKFKKKADEIHLPRIIGCIDKK